MKNVLRKYIQLKLSILKLKKLTKMKKIILLFNIAFLFFIGDIYPQACGNNEICVCNYTDHNIRVFIYPISMIFNGYKMYNLVAKHRNFSNNNILYDYQNGVVISN
jgi:hypothetical protein